MALKSFWHGPGIVKINKGFGVLRGVLGTTVSYE
jgi:hypothetical protein